MPRIPKRPLVLTLTLVALLALSPAATALPQGDALRPAAGVEPGLISQLWSLLSALWSDTGAGLDPNGGDVPSSSGAAPDTPNNDTGAGLDPNG